MCLIRLRLLLGLVALIVIQCKPEKTENVAVDIRQYNWGTSTNTVLENGFYHSKESLDTIKNQLVGDTLIPISISGTNIIIEKLEPLKMELKNIDGIDDFYITETAFELDTFKYEVKNYFGKTFLILISEHSSSYAYELKNSSLKVAETNNLNFPDYRIEGYAVGDIINRDDIEVVSKDQFGTSLTEQVILINNQDVIIKVINEKYIEEIQWTNIIDSETFDLIKQLNNVFSSSPDIEYVNEDIQSGSKEALQYYWSENEVNVLLTRVNEFGELADVWSLSYSNLIVSNILNNYLDELPENL